ncbi:phage minor head protein [Mameliella sp. MMSF_3455]|uniref:phage head morphogenesis protein n=1 Tax=Mameliella sp. MMSF_3455 TaxID=3046714 RepID=UPI00273EE902|nr:phage minor head protein [Mameliella sp. MMSF_3455]
MADFATTFRKPFKEQVAAFRLRLGNQVPTAKWDDLWKAQHDRAFMVAGAAKADLLADLAKAVEKSIAEGTSLEEFRRDFRQIVERRGWHGWTGEGTKKGEAWRTRIIYQTNMRTSYAAGRHAQLVEGGFKYWVYRHGGALEPREQHLAWDGLILPADHPFWATHYPPNGWGCSCYVVGARSLRQAIRLGGNPDVTLPDNWRDLNPKSGEPDGIDRGWGYAPGATVSNTVSALAGKLDSLPEQPSVDLIQSWLTENLFGNWLADPKGLWPMLRLSDEQAERIGASTRVAMMSERTAEKQLREHPELTIFDYGQAQRVVQEATEVLHDGDKNLIFVLAPQGMSGHVLVVKATRTGKALFVTSFRRLSGSEEVKRRTIERLRRRNSD